MHRNLKFHPNLNAWIQTWRRDEAQADSVNWCFINTKGEQGEFTSSWTRRRCDRDVPWSWCADRAHADWKKRQRETLQSSITPFNTQAADCVPAISSPLVTIHLETSDRQFMIISIWLRVFWLEGHFKYETLPDTGQKVYVLMESSSFDLPASHRDPQSSPES